MCPIINALNTKAGLSPEIFFTLVCGGQEIFEEGQQMNAHRCLFTDVLLVGWDRGTIVFGISELVTLEFSEDGDGFLEARLPKLSLILEF